MVKNYKREFLERFKVYFPISKHPQILKEDNMYKLKFLDTEIAISLEEGWAKDEIYVSVLYKKGIGVLEGFNISATNKYIKEKALQRKQMMEIVENKDKNTELKRKIKKIANKTMKEAKKEEIKQENKELQQIINEKKEIVRKRQKEEKTNVLREEEKKKRKVAELNKQFEEKYKKLERKSMDEMRKEMSEVMHINDNKCINKSKGRKVMKGVEIRIKKSESEDKNEKDDELSTKNDKNNNSLIIENNTNISTELENNKFRKKFSICLKNNKKRNKQKVYVESTESTLMQLDPVENNKIINFDRINSPICKRNICSTVNVANEDCDVIDKFVDYNDITYGVSVKKHKMKNENIVDKNVIISDPWLKKPSTKIIGGVLNEGDLTPALIYDEQYNICEFTTKITAREYNMNDRYKYKMVEGIKKERGFDILRAIDCKNEYKNDYKNIINGQNNVIASKTTETVVNEEEAVCKVKEAETVLNSAETKNNFKQSDFTANCQKPFEMTKNFLDMPIDRIDLRSRDCFNKILYLSRNKENISSFIINKTCRCYKLMMPEYEITRENDVYVCEAIFYQRTFSSNYEYSRETAKEGASKLLAAFLEENLEKIIEIDHQLQESTFEEISTQISNYKK